MSLVQELIRSAMERRHLTQMEVGKRLGYSNNALVSQVLRDDRRIPLDSIERWADALEMNEAETRVFIRAAFREYGPSYIVRLIDEHDQLRCQLEQLRQEVEGITGQAASGRVADDSSGYGAQ